MIDININAIISQALAAAVQQALQPLQQEYANKMGQMAQQIAALEARLLALENNPAQGVDTTLEQRVAALEYQSANRHERLRTLEGALTDRVAALEETLERLDNQEWFWDKIRRFTDGAVEQAIEQHCEEYDHDDMLMSDALPDMDDYVTKDDMRDEVSDAVRDLMEGATVSIRL